MLKVSHLPPTQSLSTSLLSTSSLSTSWHPPLIASSDKPYLNQFHQISVSSPAIFSRRGYLPTKREKFWLLKSGIVRTLTYQEDGTVVALGLWSAGDVVGLPLSSANPYLIEALTEVSAVSIDSSEWQPPADVLLSYLQQTERLMILRANRRAELALLGILRWLADRFGQQVNRGYLIDLKVTHQDLAEFSGTTRVTVTRLLRQFEQQGVIYRRSRRLILAETTDHWHYEI